ncbi:MAG: hypothetical protein GY851_03315 [bacterium]|nr:hypothetical protein [bacterium]
MAKRKKDPVTGDAGWWAKLDGHARVEMLKHVSAQRLVLDNGAMVPWAVIPESVKQRIRAWVEKDAAEAKDREERRAARSGAVRMVEVTLTVPVLEADGPFPFRRIAVPLTAKRHRTLKALTLGANQTGAEIDGKPIEQMPRVVMALLDQIGEAMKGT